LKAGDTIIVDGVARLHPGSEIALGGAAPPGAPGSPPPAGKAPAKDAAPAKEAAPAKDGVKSAPPKT